MKHLLLILLLFSTSCMAFPTHDGKKDNPKIKFRIKPQKYKPRMYKKYSPKIIRYQHPWLSNFSIMMGAGLSAYNGDLSTFKSLRLQRYFFNPHASLAVQYRWTQHLSFRMELSAFQLYTDSPYPQLAKSVTTRGIDAYVGVVQDLFPKQNIDHGKIRINPYLFAGIGVSKFSPKSVDKSSNGSQGQTHGSATYSTTAAILPVGLGLSYHFTESVSIHGEASMRFTSSDYIDGVSGEQKTNNFNDQYYLYSLKVNFQLQGIQPRWKLRKRKR
ncbi:hypothetical protein AAG747_02185 [Rapidithrix thailandica]|uniref:DUF6089 domain-containing protein n=1 Tax=Rapidithrix thailandica TaxID=413964 RepID=A0AAW9RYP8_9BACT